MPGPSIWARMRNQWFTLSSHFFSEHIATAESTELVSKRASQIYQSEALWNLNITKLTIGDTVCCHSSIVISVQKKLRDQMLNWTLTILSNFESKVLEYRTPNQWIADPGYPKTLRGMNYFILAVF